MTLLRKSLAAAALIGVSVSVRGEELPKLSPDLHPPVRLEADGKPIDHGAAWGHAGPCVFDVDDDGKRDLVVGDFSGEFTLYKNAGTNNQPRFTAAGKLMAGDEPAKVWIYCCIGSSPQFADLDGDGNADLISGSYDPGICYWFPGNGDGTFRGRGEAKLEDLIGDTTPLVSEDDSSVTDSDANGLPLLDKSGRPILRVPDQKQTWESYGSWPYPIDWDADGDLDFVIGGFGGDIQSRENLGTSTAFAFSETAVAIEADGKPIGAEVGTGKVEPGMMHAALVVVDWDSDGLFDLVSGFDDGSVRWLRNVGRKRPPAFAVAELLVPPHEGHGYGVFVEPGETPKPGIRTQVAVADMNGDGKLDLLSGDFSTTKSPRPDLTAEQRQEYEKSRDRFRTATETIRFQNLTKLRNEINRFLEQFPEEERTSDEVQEMALKKQEELKAAPDYVAAHAEYEASKKALDSFLEKPEHSKSFDEYASSHGFVWLYLRK